jgi:hypothetical protein
MCCCRKLKYIRYESGNKNSNFFYTTVWIGLGRRYVYCLLAKSLAFAELIAFSANLVVCLDFRTTDSPKGGMMQFLVYFLFSRRPVAWKTSPFFTVAAEKLPSLGISRSRFKPEALLVTG